MLDYQELSQIFKVGFLEHPWQTLKEITSPAEIFGPNCTNLIKVGIQVCAIFEFKASIKALLGHKIVIFWENHVSQGLSLIKRILGHVMLSLISSLVSQLQL